MEEKNKVPVDTGTESKWSKIFRRVLVSVFALGFLFLFYKMVASKLG